MMKYIYIIWIGAFALLSLSGCSNEVAVPEEGEQVPISFSANLPAVSVEPGTRAAGLSEGAKIAVVAANAPDELPISSNWNQANLYIDHVTGDVGEATWVHGYPEYPIKLADNPLTPDNKWYWHFEPDKYLSFLAYSPIAGTEGDNRVSRDDMDLTVKNGAEDGSFPDLLYTGAIGNYNKSRVSVLFNFKHAMARLAVEVVVVDQNDELLPEGLHPVDQIEISSLVVKTKIAEGVFSLEDSEWAPFVPEGSYQTAYTGATPASPLPVPYNNKETSVWYLLPGKVEFSCVDFKVKDKNTGEEVGGEYTLDQFKQLNEQPVTLEMGKTTVLTIKIRYTGIPNPDEDIILEGQLVDWEYKGKSEVIIG